MGRSVSFGEIVKAFNFEPDVDKKLIEVIQKIIIHEFGGALFKLSHRVNRELEELFIGRQNILSSRAQEEIELINQTEDLNDVKRTDWSKQEELPEDFRELLRRQIERFRGSVSERSREVFLRAFRFPGPYELPLPVPLDLLGQDSSDKDKIIRILENMLRMMDGTDENVLRDFERAIDNARDRVTGQALEQFDQLSDGQVYQILTQEYFDGLPYSFI